MIPGQRIQHVRMTADYELQPVTHTDLKDLKMWAD